MANNQLLASDTFASGSLAAGWSAVTGSVVSQIAGSPFVAEPAGLGGSSDQVWTGLAWPNDQISEITVSALTAETGTGIGLWTRIQAGAMSGYLANFNNSALTIFKCTAGAFTAIAGPTAFTPAPGDIVTFSAAGAALTLYRNNQLVLRIGDATYTSGTPGFRENTTVNVTHAKVASWRGYSVLQQDGIWAKKGIVLPALASDLSSQVGVNNAQILYEGNAQILSPNPDGKIYKMWFTGGANIYYAESNDGVAWTRRGAALINSFSWPFIFKDSPTSYHLYAQPSAQPGSGNIAHYTSADGITWVQQSANVFSLGGVGTWDHLILWYLQPVAIIGGTWYALYSGGNNTTSYQLSLGLATSPDGIVWTKYPSNPVYVLPNSGSVVNSGAIVNIGGIWYMWGYGSQPGFGGNSPNLDPGEGIRLQSPDLINWSYVHSAHRTQYHEGVNFNFGQCYPNAIIDIAGKANLYLQDCPADFAAPKVYQMSLAIGPAPIASVVQKLEDGTVQLASDNFTSGIGDLSSNWATPATLTKMQIVAGNLVEATATNVINCMYNVGATYGNNQYSEITVHTLGTSNKNLSAAVQIQPSGETFYYVFLGGPLGSAFNCRISKVVNAAVVLQGPAFQITPQIGDVLRIAIVGNVVSFYQNGFLVFQLEDTSGSVLTGGAPGFYMFVPTGGALSDDQISAWAGGNTNVLPSYPSLVSGNAGIAGATVNYAGAASGSVVADGSGKYTIPSLAAGSYSIFASKTGYSFQPASQGVTIDGSGAPITGINFTAKANTLIQFFTGALGMGTAVSQK